MTGWEKCMDYEVEEVSRFKFAEVVKELLNTTST